VLIEHDEVTDLTGRVRATFRARVSGDPSGAPDWVRDIADVGSGPGWFEPNGVVWRVHGDLSTLVGGVAALLSQAAHPDALRGVERHSDYRSDPWKRLAGTARWLVVTTFGSAELAEREAARVRGLHDRVRGSGYAASDPALLRWVHLAFTDAFLASQLAVGRDLTGRFGRSWPDQYVEEWARSARVLGATDLPTSARELDEALAAVRGSLQPVPERMRAFVLRPPGLSASERLFYATLSAGAGLLVSPHVADFARVPGRAAPRPTRRTVLLGVRQELALLHLALGRFSPSEEAARYRLAMGPAPSWLAA
jgi:uncharacterized protein (DUF2236 family)